MTGTEPQAAFLAKARRYLRSAELLCDDGDVDSAVSRLYYAQFFVAEALLDALGLAFSSHRAVISAFGEHFSLTGELDSAFHRLLIGTFEKRQFAEYATGSTLTPAVVARLLSQTGEFIAAGEQWLADRSTRSAR